MNDRVTVIGVAWAGGDDDFRAFVDRHALTFPNISDPEGKVYARFGVPFQPAWVYLDTDGSSRVHQGSVNEVTVLSELEALVKD